MQADVGQEPQVALTMPLLVGTDGVKKMSKSYGNYVAFNDTANDIFGKIMKLSDELMLSYYELLTTEDLEAIRKEHPMEAKKRLASLLTSRFHGAEAGPAARKFFEDTFSKKELPTDIREVALPKGLSLSELILRAEGVKSRNEARRLITQGGVKIDGKKAAEDKPVDAPPTFVLQMGKHQFVRVNLT
jgi:tyrosyl-tRNA synthetase